jgi:hypothetical protein
VISAAVVDRLILSFCDTRWRKVARIIGQTYDALERRGIVIFHGIAKLMDARMAALVRNGKLEAIGNIKRWGYSEVRLPPGTQPCRSLIGPASARGLASRRKQKRVKAAKKSSPLPFRERTRANGAGPMTGSATQVRA